MYLHVVIKNVLYCLNMFKLAADNPTVLPPP